MKLSPTLEQRFRKYTKRARNGCLEWQKACVDRGPGVMSIGTGISKGAHHVAWFLETGVWPERLMHSCDNPPCCEFAHLSEGTAADNAADMVAKGRSAYAERHGMHKLTIKQVSRMRRLRSEGKTLLELAKQFDTCQSNVSSICRYLTRKKG